MNPPGSVDVEVVASPSVPVDDPPHGRRRSVGRTEKFVRKYGAAALVVVVIIGVWQLVVRLDHVKSYLFPAPSDVASDFPRDWHILGPALWVTGREVIFGFLIAIVAGVGLAVVLHLSGFLRRALYPLLIGSQTIPIVVLAPILVILLGYGIMPKLVIIALTCFFPIVVNGLDGLRARDSDYILMMKTLHASRWSIFRRVEFPGALPSLLSGMRIAATFASIGAVFGEWSGSNNGIGYVILESTPNLQTARIFAGIVLLTAMSLVLFGLVAVAERVLVPWAPKADPTS